MGNVIAYFQSLGYKCWDGGDGYIYIQWERNLPRVYSLREFMDKYNKDN